MQVKKDMLPNLNAGLQFLNSEINPL